MEVVLVLVVAAVAVVVVWRMRGALEGNPRDVTRALAAVAPSPIGDVVAGARHRLDGIARPVGAPGSAPASGRPCLAYDVWVSAFPGDSPSRRSAQAASDLLLEVDGTVLLVRGDGAAVSIERDHEAPETTLDQVPFADQVLRSQGVSIGSQSTCRLQMREGVIAPGDAVAVLGLVEAPDEEAARLGATWLLRAAPGQPLLIGRP